VRLAAALRAPQLKNIVHTDEKIYTVVTVLIVKGSTQESGRLPTAGELRRAYLLPGLSGPFNPGNYSAAVDKRPDS
jgi:hypothetical protein